jgi:hypothetical protein
MYLSPNADPHRKGNVQNALTPSPGQQAVVNTLAAPAKALIDTPRIAEAIHRGVNTFMEAVPPLMDALDEVAKVHPFIGGTSSSFGTTVVLTAVYFTQLPSLHSRPYTRSRRNDAGTTRRSWHFTLSLSHRIPIPHLHLTNV